MKRLGLGFLILPIVLAMVLSGCGGKRVMTGVPGGGTTVGGGTGGTGGGGNGGDTTLTFDSAFETYPTSLEGTIVSAAQNQPTGSVTQSSTGTDQVSTTVEFTDDNRASFSITANAGGNDAWSMDTTNDQIDSLESRVTTIGTAEAELAGAELRKGFSGGTRVAQVIGLRRSFGPDFGFGTDYLSGGAWVFVPDDTTNDQAFEYGAFFGGSDPFFQQAIRGVLTGRADYKGLARGNYTVSKFTTNPSANHQFSADVELRANFDAGTNGLGKIRGSVTNFEGGGINEGETNPLENWELTLETADITDAADGGFFTGSTNGIVGSRMLTGQWGGKFFGSGGVTEHPDAAAGTFGAADSDGAGLAGFFAAYLSGSSGIDNPLTFSNAIETYSTSLEGKIVSAAQNQPTGSVAQSSTGTDQVSTTAEFTDGNRASFSMTANAGGADAWSMDSTNNQIDYFESNEITTIGSAELELAVADLQKGFSGGTRVAQVIGLRRSGATDYLAGGAWVFVPDDTTNAQAFEFGAFFGGSDPFTRENIEGLTGSATYTGVAAGNYTASKFTTNPTADHEFFANVGLTANFDAGANGLGTIGGSVTDFSEDPLGDLELTLGTADITGAADGGFFTGSTNGTVGSRMLTGQWGGKFFGNGAAGTDHPDAAAGTFGAADSDGAGLAGYFAAFKD